MNAILRDYDKFSNPTVSVRGTESQSINSKLHQMTIVVYISLTLSVILTVMFLLCAIAALVVYCKFRQCNTKPESKSASPRHAHNQAEPIYEDMPDRNNNTDIKDIKMKTNILYKRP